MRGDENVWVHVLLGMREKGRGLGNGFGSRD